MKSIKFWILVMTWIVFNCYQSYAQTNNQLITTILPVGGVVPQGNLFRVDVSFTYNTTLYSNYRLKMELPSGVTWPSMDFTTDPTSIAISSNDITNTGNTTYIIPFTPKVAGIKSTNFFLDNLINNTQANCLSSIISDINFTLEADENSVTQTIETYVSPLTTPQGSDSPGSLTLELSQGQELNQDNSNTGNFPYYIDVRITGYLLSTLPTVNLTYPASKMTFINAMLYNNQIGYPPFHKSILDQTSITQSSGSLGIILANNPNTYNNTEGDFIRFYFTTNIDGQLLQNEINLSATGAKYRKCDLSEVALPDQNKVLADFPIVTSAALYPSIDYKNLALQFCPQNCNFNVNGFESRFHFEINDIYTQFGSTIPRVKVQCPVGAAKISKLEFDASQYSSAPAFTYLVQGSSVEQAASVSGNTVTFGTDNPQVIYINNYAASNAANIALDFAIYYTSLFSDLSSVSDPSKEFFVNYENFINTKVYTSQPMQISYVCYPGMNFRDDYENNQQSGFTDYVSYLPGSHENILLTISPRDKYFTGTYTISGFRYQLNSNMTFDPTDKYIYYSETGLPGSYKPLRSIVNGSYYKSIDVKILSSPANTIEINATLNNAISADCGLEKALYIMIPVEVNGNASYTSGWYQSSIQDNAGSFTTTYLSHWNVERSIIDKLSAEVKVVCPGDGQEMSDFEQGQIITVQYIINNENQNPVKDLNYSIPGIASGLVASTAPNGGIRIRSKNSTSGNLNSSFAISSQGNGLSISSNSYILSGNDKIYIDVQYVLDQSLAVGSVENNISFILNSFNSIDGIPRAEVEPSVTKGIKIVVQSECVPTPPCQECVTSFSPIPGQEYLLSGWIKEAYTSSSTTPTPKSYVNSGIQVSFNDGDIVNLPLFQPSGPIIDGWQRVEASFTVPSNAYNILIEMVNNGKNDAFFDDIRVHPFRSNMKSFVYDPSTQKLVAELDENNYATQYEYDDEGILIRVKKETERGVMTIKETRNNQSKIKKYSQQ